MDEKNQQKKDSKQPAVKVKGIGLERKYVKVIIIFAGFVVFLICYLALYNGFKDKRDEELTQISTLQPTLDQLKEYDANSEKYQSEIDDAKTHIGDVLGKLPSDVEPEDEILYLTGLEDKLQVKASSISFAEPYQITQFNSVLPGSVDDTSNMPQVTTFEKQSIITLDLDYGKMKSLLDEVYNNSNYYNGIDSLAVAYNAETGGLTGTMTLDKFFMTYDGAPDYTTELPQVPYGLSNPFGTAEGGPVQTPPAQ